MNLAFLSELSLGKLPIVGVVIKIWISLFLLQIVLFKAGLFDLPTYFKGAYKMELAFLLNLLPEMCGFSDSIRCL